MKKLFASLVVLALVTVLAPVASAGCSYSECQFALTYFCTRGNPACGVMGPIFMEDYENGEGSSCSMSCVCGGSSYEVQHTCLFTSLDDGTEIKVCLSEEITPTENEAS